MKPHLIIELKNAVPLLPHWEELLFDKIKSTDRFDPIVKKVLANKQIKVWYAQEFKKKGKDWSEAEKAAGLNKIYRVIYQVDDKKIDLDLIKQLKAIDNVVSVYAGSIAISQIPKIATGQSFRSTHPGELIQLKAAHAFSKGHPSVTIAVLDTGVDIAHQEFKDNMLPGMDFVNIIDGANRFIGDHTGYDEEPDDEVGHGTHVSGIIAARGLKMPIGVAPHCKILPVRVLGSLKKGKTVVGAGLIDNINNGIKWAVDQGADIINMSLGIKHLGGGLPHHKVVKYALAKGVSVVAASGNDGQKDKYYPGALPGVIAVGASDPFNDVAHFSTYGAHVSFIAPGTNVYSSFPGGKYTIASGTSQAAPFVAGALALLKSYSKKLGKKINNQELEYILRSTSDRIGTRYKDAKAGYGLINLLDALKHINHQYKYSLN